MTTQISSTPSTPDVGQMRFALDLVRWYSIHFPELPAPYVTVQAHPGSTVLGIQVQDAAHFEMWREALEFDAENVELIGNGSSSWLSLRQKTRKFQVSVNLTTHAIPTVSCRPVEGVEVAA